MLLRKC